MVYKRKGFQVLKIRYTLSRDQNMTKWEYLMDQVRIKHEQCRVLLAESTILQEQAENLTLKESKELYIPKEVGDTTP